MEALRGHHAERLAELRLAESAKKECFEQLASFEELDEGDEREKEMSIPSSVEQLAKLFAEVPEQIE
eukprot:5385486-Alexandrium_andersonii.AAC.1